MPLYSVAFCQRIIPVVRWVYASFQGVVHALLEEIPSKNCEVPPWFNERTRGTKISVVPSLSADNL